LDFGCELIACVAGAERAGAARHGKQKARVNFPWTFEKQMLDLNF
jgi:hypothetical protein